MTCLQEHGFEFPTRVWLEARVALTSYPLPPDPVMLVPVIPHMRLVRTVYTLNGQRSLYAVLAEMRSISVRRCILCTFPVKDVFSCSLYRCVQAYPAVWRTGALDRAQGFLELRH